MKPVPERQHVDAALAIWASAERNQQGVVVDDNGTIELLYRSVRQQAPEVSAALTRHAVQQMIGKIHSEVQRLAAASGSETSESLMAKIPSLGRFAASGKLGNLRTEWQQLTRERAATIERLVTERQHVFNEFRAFMPAMPMRTEANGTVIYQHDFDSPASQEQLREELADIDKYKVKTGELSSQFKKDLDRSFWRIDVDGASHSFGLNNGNETLAALRKAFDNADVVLATVSKLLNQTMPTMVLATNAKLFPNSSIAVLKSDQQNDEPSFFQIKRRGETIELSVDVYAKIDSVNLPGGLDNPNDRSWRTNQGPRWSGPPGPGNYGRHTHVSFTLDLAAARIGELRPLEGTKLNGFHAVRLCPAVREKP